jgi:hypothetical protein
MMPPMIPNKVSCVTALSACAAPCVLAVEGVLLMYCEMPVVLFTHVDCNPNQIGAMPQPWASTEETHRGPFIDERIGSLCLFGELGK